MMLNNLVNLSLHTLKTCGKIVFVEEFKVKLDIANYQVVVFAIYVYLEYHLSLRIDYLIVRFNRKYI